MKTYLINTLKNISTINRSLDFVSTVKTSEWTIFNEEKTCIEKFLFVDDEYIYVSVNGKTSSLKWKYIKVNESLIIDDGINKYLFKVNAARKSKVDDNTAKMQSIKWLGV
ncbi:hypothetical protein ABG835_13705 [Phocaeicola vulgatus]